MSLPLNISDVGKLHTYHKSQLTGILQAQVDMPERAPEGEVIIVDGSAVVNTTPPRTSRTTPEKTNFPRLNYMTQHKTPTKELMKLLMCAGVYSKR